jgi:hypothetical protein
MISAIEIARVWQAKAPTLLLNFGFIFKAISLLLSMRASGTKMDN